MEKFKILSYTALGFQERHKTASEWPDWFALDDDVPWKKIIYDSINC